MANSAIHAKASARRYGGTAEQYFPLHDFMDASKASWADQRHRALLHHSEGIFLGELVFGHLWPVTLEDGRTKQVPVRQILEDHVIEDVGFIPTLKDWLDGIPAQALDGPRGAEALA
jgi:hypothetical protein